MLNIEVARLYRLDGEGPLKAIADVRINGSILIKGVRVLAGKKGLFVSMPTSGKDGKWYPIVMITDKAQEDSFNHAVLEAFDTE